MCGGFVVMSSEGARTQAERRLAPLAYHGGRLLAYLTLAALSGALGGLVNAAGATRGMGQVAGLLAGSVMLLWGLAALLESQGVRLLPRARKWLPDRLVARMVALVRRPPIERSLLLGLSSALLPCGWLYGFVLVGAGTGSVLGSVSVLAAFWAGNLPLLLGFGAAVAHVSTRIRRHAPLLGALSMLLLGLVTVLGRVNLPALALSQVLPVAGAAELAAMPKDCPYHRHPAP
jgi:sulfite exporter TauE/SafE